MYYRNANCAVVVYDITQSVRAPILIIVLCSPASQASLDKARTWIRELQRQADPSIVILLCGNKTDLEARRCVAVLPYPPSPPLISPVLPRQVSKEEAQKYAEEEGLMWGEASAKSGEGVNEIFTAIGELSPSHILSSRY